ncbi:MAG: NADH:ubiquinone reductase (Na(+)-transporting) subunit F, partial [Octadecabacter sp.]|nr:NADH:ubiquinone reductase (Na(+)-transporting) subunit F [Octadecabacter sp.]
MTEIAITEIALGSLTIAALVVLLAAGLLATRRRLIPQGSISVTVNDTLHINAARGGKLLSALH